MAKHLTKKQIRILERLRAGEYIVVVGDAAYLGTAPDEECSTEKLEPLHQKTFVGLQEANAVRFDEASQHWIA